MEKAYDKAENNQPLMHAKLMLHKVFYMQKLTNKQSAKVICRFDRLITAHCKRNKPYINLENLSATHAFNSIRSAQS